MSPLAKPLGHLRLGVNIDHVATVRNARARTCRTGRGTLTLHESLRTR